MTIPTIMAHSEGVMNNPIDNAEINLINEEIAATERNESDDLIGSRSDSNFYRRADNSGNEGIKSDDDESRTREISPCKTNAAYFNQKWISKTSKLLEDNPIRSTKKKWMKGERHLSKMTNSYNENEPMSHAIW